jgi:alpha-glucosidase
MITQPLTQARAAGQTDNTWRVATDQGTLSLSFMADDIARVAFTPPDAPPHQTWATLPTISAIAAEESAVNELMTLRTASLAITVALGAQVGLTITRADGSVLLAHAADGGLGRDATGNWAWHSALSMDDRVFGGGQRTGPLDKRGRRLTLWATDPLPNHSDETDAMYQSVAFFPILRDGLAHGILFDATWRGVVDIGQADPATLAFSTEGPDLVAYFCAGPTLADVLRQYTDLTGRMPPQPRWSLGNQQSRWSYLTADEVRAVAAKFRAEQIPCDAIYLDIDYMDGYRDFTFNPTAFPDPGSLIADLRAQGFRVVPIIDPGVKIDAAYQVYHEGLTRGYFVRNPDGSVFAGWVWPGHTVWTDYANAEARAWWGAQHQPLIALGVGGIWIDMNEPSQAAMSAPPEVTVPFGATLPADTVHHSTAYGTLSHAAFHNAYGHEMAHATYDALASQRPDERVFILSRAAQAGTQRYGIVWNGDNTSQWEHVGLAIRMNLGVGLSGFPVSGCDIGGFWGDSNGELLVRFTQVGAFLPFCRNHSSQGTAHQEPWAFGEPYTSAIRAALAQRYRLLPLLVTLFHEANTTGAPVIRPLAWIAPDDPASVACDDQFLLGNDLLIAPVITEGATERTVTLPPGAWCDWTTGAIHPGGTTLTVPVDLATVPIFQRAGSIIPVAGDTQHTGESADEPLTLEVCLAQAGQTATLLLWDDDDHPQAAARGTFAAYRVTARWEAQTISVRVEQIAGQMAPRYPGLAVALHLPEDVTVDNDGLAEGPFTLPAEFRFAVQ